MNVALKNNKVISLHQFKLTELDDLLDYLEHVSVETRKRFGPHAFDRQTVNELYLSADNTGFIARDTETTKVIAYAIVRTGYLDHDRERLNSYGLQLSKQTDCTFAPSVADGWQGLGVGISLYHFIVGRMKEKGINRIILWGGVQASNERAVHYYRQLGFTLLGEFEYYGSNYDMLAAI